jgi:D-alanyl-D-alanine carboxypeptidase
VRHRVMFSVTVLILLASPASVTAQSALPPVSPQLRATLDSIAQSFVAAANTPGSAVAVVRGNDTLVFRGYGVANLEVGTPVTVTSVFRIGSVTKQFTSTAVLQLAEQGKLALTDTIGRWLPNLPRKWRGVTVTQLLNHTSGIFSYTELGESWAKRWGEEMTGAQIAGLTATRPFDFAPGTSWKYNNTGYVLLGMLVEARGGRTWGEDFATRFFTPLGMTRTRYCETRPVIADRASGYSRDGAKPWMNSTYLAMSQPHAAGALCSTIGDLLTWNRALHGAKLLQPASYTAMTTPIGSAVPRSYGFGIGKAQIGSRTMLTHGGGIPGFLTANLYVPDAELSVTVLTNGDANSPDDLAVQLARVALGVPSDPKATRVSLSVEELRRYAGTYSLVLGTARPFSVTEKDGKAYGQLEGQQPSEMVPLGNHTFGADFDPTVRIIFTMADGRPTKMTLRQRGQEFEGVRRP